MTGVTGLDGTVNAGHGVAVADVDCGGGVDAFDAAVKGLDAPVGDLFGVAAENRFIELDDRGIQAVELAGLTIQDICDGHGEVALAAVVGVEGGVDDGHRAGQGHLHGAGGLGLQEAQVIDCQGAGPADRADTPADLGEAAAVANPLLGQGIVVEAFEAAGYIGQVGLPALLSVGDYVDSGQFLDVDSHAGGVFLGLGEQVAVEVPVGAAAVMVGPGTEQGPLLVEPGGPGHASDDGCGEGLWHRDT